MQTVRETRHRICGLLSAVEEGLRMIRMVSSTRVAWPELTHSASQVLHSTDYDYLSSNLVLQPQTEFPTSGVKAHSYEEDVCRRYVRTSSAAQFGRASRRGSAIPRHSCSAPLGRQLQPSGLVGATTHTPVCTLSWVAYQPTV